VAARPTSILSNIAIQATENDVDLVLELFCTAVLEHEITQLLAHGQALLPLDGVAVLLASVPGAGSDSCKSEVRVEGEEEDEALAYATSGTKNACVIVLSAIGLADETGCVRCTHAPPRKWTH
jgi:hypothetical protein